MIRSDYDQIIRENFDLSDNFTRKYLASCNEDAQQSQVLDALSNALYEKLVANVDKIDFGSIPRSRGDIDKVDGIKNTEESLNIIRRIVMEMHLDPKAVDVVITAIANLRAKKAKFIKGFTINAEFPILLYNLTVLSIEKAVGLMIAASELVIIDPASDTMKKAMNKAAYNKVEEDVFYQTLITFNNIVRTKEFDKVLDATMVAAKNEGVEILAQLGNTRIIKVTDDMAPATAPDDFFGVDDEESTPVFSNEGPDIDIDFDASGDPAPDDIEIDPPVDDPVEPDDFDDDYFDTQEDDVEPDNIPFVTPIDPGAGFEQSIDELENQNEATDFQGPMDYIKYAKENYKNLKNSKNKAVRIALRVGTAAGIVGAGVWLYKFIIKVGIPMLRNAIYAAIASRVKLSEYFAIQAEFIEANADELEYSSTATTVKDKKKVIEKQKKWAARLRTWSNKLAIDSKQTANTVASENKNDSKATVSSNSDDIF